MLRVKREYQSWVANESLEDYALRYAASSYRRWAPGVMANTALGGISFLALEAIGASITLSYGFQNAMVAVLVVSLVIFLVSLPIAYWCAVSNVDIDLLTRGAGFGYIGSTLTSLIYASFTLIFFAIETAIWAQALQLALGLQLAVGYLVCSLVIIPLVFYGVTSISKLQAWSQPVWVVMLVLPFVFILYKDPALLRAWTDYDGLGGNAPGFNLLLFGAASGVLFSLVAQIGEQADYLRFLPERTPANRRRWWAALLMAGPGWIVIGALKVSAGSLLAVLALRMGSSAAQAVEPVHMFVHAYQQVVADPVLALGLAAVFVTISQVKINVTNAYSGSLAWSNCFVRLAHYHPGRVVWLVFNVVIALLLSLLGIFETLQTVLSVYSTVAIAWVGALVADLVVLKRIGLSPPYIEFKRAHLYNFNPVGCGATVIAAVVAVLAFAGSFGALGQAFFGFIAFSVAFVSAIAIAYATQGRYYIARPDAHYRQVPAKTLVECGICEREYEAPDMAHCPFYRGPVCSLCCGLELHCHDFCKQPAAAAAPTEPPPFIRGGLRFEARVLRRLGRFLGLLSVAAVLLGSAFLLTYRFVDLHGLSNDLNLVHVMVRLYAATLAVASLGIWWIVLSHERQEQSERELLESIHHLEQTRKDLVETEKLASLGGLVAGVAHEINTPAGILVSSSSYLSDRTQAVRQQAAAGRFDAPAQQRYLDDAAESARLMLSNAQRVAQLVLNFKQLAVDRISEARQACELRELLQGTLRALQPRLDESGVQVRLDVPPGLVLESYPVALAQVVTNLVVNSLQHAFGAEAAARTIHIRVEARPDDEVRIDYSDNGRGIDPAIEARAFEPFVTTRRMLGGSGLGLYIVNQIVTRQLGGSIETHNSAQGVRFVLQFPRVARLAPDMGRILAALPRPQR
ncbi:ATP-binding protein [Pseudorhodoferax sp.]|uniref:ATP-binding protein n=1 Tax=Pseudorhodoferax sp. TaxID=1993553 RepID=UPI002DD67C8C|nr:ATP-binding protein [Pseudorhodoferax sp.]